MERDKGISQGLGWPHEQAISGEEPLPDQPQGLRTLFDRVTGRGGWRPAAGAALALTALTGCSEVGPEAEKPPETVVVEETVYVTHDSSTQTPPATTKPEATVTATPEASDDPAAVSLASLDPVTHNADFQFGGSIRMGGDTYHDAILYECRTFCNNGSEYGRVEYDLGKGYRTFSATFGVDDRAVSGDQQATLVILVDGEEVGRWHTTLAEGPIEVTVNVEDGQRLTLRIGAEDTVSPIQQFTSGAPLADVGLAEGRLTR